MTTMTTKTTRRINVGGVAVGGGAPVSVQSMTKTKTADVAATVAQIKELEAAGCEIIRAAVPNEEAAAALGQIKKQIGIPLIADIHFDYRLALTAVAGGVDALRINPGNIGALWKVREVVAACLDCGVPIRIGVNAGSLQKDLLEKYGHPTPEALVESAEQNVEILESLGFSAIKLSLKASDVPRTVEAYRLFSQRHDYPLHLGISEAGPSFSGIIKSAVGMGILLYEGIGDTMRVSLTAPPEEEVRVAWEILKSLGKRHRGLNLISCPTCGRCRVNLVEVVKEAEERLRGMDKTVTVAIMGCEVNGPGEAREADFGLAGGNGEALIFKHGKVIKKVKQSEMLDALIKAIEEG